MQTSRLEMNAIIKRVMVVASVEGRYLHTMRSREFVLLILSEVSRVLTIVLYTDAADQSQWSVDRIVLGSTPHGISALCGGRGCNLEEGIITRYWLTRETSKSGLLNVVIRVVVFPYNNSRDLDSQYGERNVS
jgi:hypothetical protein